MSDLRGGPTPTPAPAPGPDRTSFYSGDPNALPAAKGPADMPQPGWWEAARAGWQLGRDDWAGYRDQKVMDSYGPIIEALKAETGKSYNRYYWVGHNTAGVNDVNVFADLAEVRRRKPDFLAGVPGDADAFGKQVDEREAKRRAADRVTVARDRGWGSTLGGFAAGAADPWNLATLPIAGGGGATVARRILSQALINATIEGVEQPLIAAERAKRGETLTAGQAALNIGMAAGIGAGMQGLIIEPLGALAKRVIGRDRMTPDEVAAAHVVDRQADIAATSPFGAGSGAEVHAERLQAAISAILDDSAPSARARALSGTSLGSAPTPSPRDPLTVPRETSAVPREQFKAKVAGAESGGNDLAANPNSSALGRYQFVAPTWLRYYTQRFGRQGLSDEAILAKRADPALQEQLMNDMVADNAAALRRLGAPETAGNLYLMHFAGQGGAGKILRAAPDTPIEQLLSKAAIDANPFLRGKSAADVIEWAHAKMGSAAPDAVVRRGLFDDDAAGDAEWAAAQRASEAANAEAAALARERPTAQGELDFGARTAAEDADAPVQGMDWEPGTEARSAPATAEAAMPAPARAEFGSAENPTPDMLENRLPAAADAADAARRMEARMQRIEASKTRGVLADGMEYSDRVLRATAATEGVPLLGPDGAARPVAEIARDMAPHADRLTTNLRDEIGHILGDPALVQRAARERPEITVDEFRAELARVRAERGPEAIPTEAELRNRILDRRAQGQATDAPVAAVPVERELSAKAFDDPHGREADAQVQSIEHDLRIEAKDAPDTAYQIGEGEQPRTLLDILDELDADAKEIENIRGCL